ncbi:MAG: TadE/TadG family type IV pilus assembly protein [Xanthobacteraceae bacterium]|jgi:Flp pilus assembly protein TadG
MFATLRILSQGIGRLLAAGTMQRFARREDGAAAVEFGLVAAPFLALLFAILEAGLTFFAGQSLDTAASNVARQVMTGQTQSITDANTFLKKVVCANASVLFNNCQTTMMIDVEVCTTYSACNTSVPLDSQGNVQTSSLGFNQGGPGSIVLVKLMYPWPSISSMLGLTQTNMAGHVLISTFAFSNEPF